ncbi:polyamine ABC transporter substrate-binding protein [Halosolutus halophilus]|uniref:polyamine ABC transporter substrate-binding protein n=1 Tax=Halosolutus halophilus TaxID=1552990 RepID=UPI0022352E7A|nr:spermidine/putrescine ABC transporter substrate-binding protein [Halosolutus halophilus]
MDTHDIHQDRRTVLKSTGALATIGVTGFAGCLGDEDNDTGSADIDTDDLEDSLNIFQWGDYWPDGFVQSFEEEHDVAVSVSNFASNEEMFNSLQAGGTDQYDLIFPSDYMVNVLQEQDMIQPLDLDELSNFGNLSEMFQEAPYDPGDDRYSAPYQWGTSGIGWNENMIGEVEIDSWDALWNDEWAGQITMLNDMRETMGAALKRLGYSLNTTDEDEIEEAKETLIQQKDLLRAYDSTNVQTNLINKQNSPLHGWSGDIFVALWETYDEDEGYSPVNYTIPTEGGVVWVDTAAVTAKARHPNAAHAFIDYFLDAENAAEVTNYTYYGSPNAAAEEYIYDEILENESIYPDDETLENLEFIENIGQATQTYDQAWTEIQNA